METITVEIPDDADVWPITDPAKLRLMADYVEGKAAQIVEFIRRKADDLELRQMSAGLIGEYGKIKTAIDKQDKAAQLARREG